jgi:hypothetical protein
MNRKEDGTWEKSSQGEGKTVKITIEEIICVLEVLHKRSANWRGYHVFKDRKTEIYVGWETDLRQVLQVKIGEYIKKVSFPNLNFFTLLLEHILAEKIEFATSGSFESETEDKPGTDDEAEYTVFAEHITARDGLHIVEVEITAKIKVESPKALLITLQSNEEFWIPKSTVHNEYNVKNKEFQKFIVDKWIIEKHKILK